MSGASPAHFSAQVKIRRRSQKTVVQFAMHKATLKEAKRNKIRSRTRHDYFFLKNKRSAIPSKTGHGFSLKNTNLFKLSNNYTIMKVERRRYKLNNGLHIEGNGASLDIILRQIDGAGKEREAALEIISQQERKIIYLKNNTDPKEIYENIRIKVLRQKEGKGRSVSLLYIMPENYAISHKTYS